jgi:hypothetical protein
LLNDDSSELLGVKWVRKTSDVRFNVSADDATDLSLDDPEVNARLIFVVVDDGCGKNGC